VEEQRILPDHALRNETWERRVKGHGQNQKKCILGVRLL